MHWSAVLTKEFISVGGFIILFLFIKNNEKMRAFDKKWFYCVIATGIAELVVFEAELWTASFAEPTFLRVLFSVIGYTLRPILIYSLIILSDRSQFTTKNKILLAIPCVLCFLCVSTAFFSKIGFWYDSANEFHRGFLGYFPHIIGGLYMATYAYVTCKHMKKHGKLEFLIAIAISSFAVCAMIIDTFIYSAGMARVAIMLCTFFAYVQMQNRVLLSMIDDIPGAIVKFTVRNGKYQLVSFNEPLSQIFGMSHDEFASRIDTDAFLPLADEYHKQVENALKLLYTQDSSSFQFKQTSGGREICYNAVFKAVRRADGEIDAYCTIVDVTAETRMLDDLRMRNNEIDLLMNQIGKIVCIYDVSARTLTMSEQYAKLRGFRSNVAVVPDDTCKNHLVCEEFEQQYIAFYDRILSGERSGDLVAKFRNLEGEERWEKTDFITILDENGDPQRAIISIEDITKTHNEKLLLENYRSTLENLIGDDKFCVLYNLTQRKVVAYKGGLLPAEEHFENRSLEEISDYIVSHYVKDGDVELVREFMSPDNLYASYDAGILQRHIERVAVLPDGSEKWFRLNVNIDSTSGNNVVATLLWEDIDSEYRTKTDLIARANYDTLTGVLTRNATMQAIEEYLSGEGKKGIHAFIMLDVDNLKGINDTLGHQFGDAALRNFACEIKHFFRQEDIIGRIGGDEFFAFVKNISGTAISAKMNELLRNLERVYSENGKQITITASVGISMYHGDAPADKTLRELYAEADAALYKSKALGKNTFTFLDELDAIAESSLSEALLKDDLISYSLKELMNNLANGIAIFRGTADGKITPVLCNENLPKFLGITHEQFNAHMSVENGYAIHPDDVEQAKNVLKKAIKVGRSIRQVFRILTGMGNYRFVTVFSNVHHNEDGTFDLYCVFSDAEEAEQLHRIQELRHRQLEQKLMQVTDKNEAYVLLNITQNTCIEQFEPHVPEHRRGDQGKKTAEKVLSEIAEDIAFEESRKEFLEKFSMEAFEKGIKEGTVAKEMRLPFTREERGAEWYCMKSELSVDPDTNDIEVFASFENIDNEMRLEYTINRLLDDEYEYICQIDIKSGFVARIGENDEDGLSAATNGKARYNDLLSRGIEHLLPPEQRENGLESLSLKKIISELEKQERYYVVFPVVMDDGRGERLCQWSCEYSDSSHSTILMCRKNISGILNCGYDTLTGMIGRQGFYRKVRSMLNDDPQGSYYLVEINFDNFRLLNDKEGYAGGNRFIRQFGADAVRLMEKKGSRCFVGHFEADRFMFICSSAVIKKPEELYDSIVAQTEAYPMEYHLKLRMGVYEIDDPSLNEEWMCDCAQLALDACRGRFDRFINYYSADLKDRMLDEQLLVSEMQNAIDTEQFEVWFQPQINHSNNGTLVGAEALVRWRHPTRNMISPGLFIPLFEQNGFVYELDKYIWKKVAKYIRNWLDEGRHVIPVSVNVSRVDIMHDDFLDTVVSIVEEQGIPYELMHLEVTESAFADNSGKVVGTVKALIDRGFIVAIDDFGSGYSSLSMLKSVPAHILKLDMRFFANEEESVRSECVIESMVRMAKMLGMSVLAEGVESVEQADRLCAMGCDYIQGYLYSKPLTYDAYVEYFSRTSGEAILRRSMVTREEIAKESAVNQELYRSIISGTNDIILVVDINTKQLLYANHAAEQFYGKSFDPLKKITCSEYCENPTRCKNCPSANLKVGEKREVVFNDNGMYAKAMYLRVEWNGHDAFVKYQTDISSEMREKELADQLIRNIPGKIVVFSLDEKGEPKISYLSARVREVLSLAGIGENMPTFAELMAIVHPEDRERVYKVVSAAIAEKQGFREEFRILLGGGEHMWIDLAVNSVADQNGDYQFYGIYTNVTDRKNTQEKADMIIQSIPSAMAIYAFNNGNVGRIFVSDSAKKILRIKEENHEKVSMDVVYDRIHPEDREHVRSVTMDCIEKRLPFSLQFRTRGQGTEYRWLQLDSTPIVRNENECYFYSIYTDIQAQKQIESEKKEKQYMLSSYDAVNRGLREALMQPTSDASIAYILEFVGKALDCERVYIFEKNADGTDSNTFEWVAEGVSPEKDNLQNIPAEISAPWYESFHEQSTVVIEDVENIRTVYPQLYEALAPQGIRSLVVAPFFDGRGRPVGFFGVDNPSKEELLGYPALSQTIAFFIEAAIKRRNLENLLESRS